MTHAKRLRIDALQDAVAACEHQIKLLINRYKRKQRAGDIDSSLVVKATNLCGSINYLKELLRREGVT